MKRFSVFLSELYRMKKKHRDILCVSNLFIIHHIWLRSRNLDFWKVHRTCQWSSKYIFWILIFMQLFTKIWCRMKSSTWCRHLVKVIDNLFLKLQFSTICFVLQRRNVLKRQILIILKDFFFDRQYISIFFFNSDTLFITLTSAISS